MMGFVQATLAILRKDLLIELRTGEIVVTTTLFATLVTILTSLSFYVDRNTALMVAPGVLWITLVFSGLLAMSRSWGRERDNDVFRALLLSPVPRAAIYWGKALGSLGFLLVIEAILLLEVGVLFSLDLTDVLVPLGALLLLGTLGFVATGNLFAAMGVRTSMRDMALSVALFPIVAPALLCGVVATRELLHGAPLVEIYAWMKIMAGFDVAVMTAATVIFEPIIED